VKTRTAALAEFFRGRPLVWIDGADLGAIAGRYAWRSRISDLRHGPFFMNIENRQRRARQDGRSFVISEYRFVPREVARKEESADAGGMSTSALLF
jgi:hypothetical protein